MEAQFHEIGAVFGGEQLSGRVDVAAVLIVVDGEERALREYACSSRDELPRKDAEPFGACYPNFIHW